MIRHSIVSLSVATLLAGCATEPYRYPAIATPPAPIAEREATAVFLAPGSCAAPETTGTGGSAIAAALIGVGVDFAMSAVGAALKRLKEGRNATWVATAATTDLRPRADQERQICLTLARGVVTTVGSGPAPLPNNLYFRDEPAFFLRLDLTLGKLAGKAAPAAAPAAGGDKPKEGPAAEAVFLKAVPYELRYADTSAPIRGNGRKNVSVVVAFSPQTLQPVSGEAATPDTSKATVLRLDFGRLLAGRVYDQTLLSTVSAVASFPNAARTTVTAIVSETEKPSAALEALLTAYESNKGDLGKAFKDAITEAVGGKSE